MTAGRVHLLYGLAGSGKSTLARELTAEGKGVRFTLDEWMLRLHPDLSFDDEEYGVRAAEVRELIWSVAEQVLAAGIDAVLDWNSWSRERRRWAVERATVLGATVVLHRLGASVEVASARAKERTATGVGFAHPITRADNEHLASLMEEPAADEGIQICDHRGQAAARGPELRERPI